MSAVVAQKSSRLLAPSRLVRGLSIAVVMLLAQACDSGAPGGGTSATPEQTYQRFCFSCHTTGAAGAPKTGDVADWAPRIAQGREVMLRNTIDGMASGMPARGLCVQCTDAELGDVLDYMVTRSQ